MKKLLALAIAAAPMAGALAGDQENLPKFKQLDVDRDGKISVTEATANEKFAALFEKLDINRDGGISAEEYADLFKPQTM